MGGGEDRHGERHQDRDDANRGFRIMQHLARYHDPITTPETELIDGAAFRDRRLEGFASPDGLALSVNLEGLELRLAGEAARPHEGIPQDDVARDGVKAGLFHLADDRKTDQGHGMDHGILQIAAESLGEIGLETRPSYSGERNGADHRKVRVTRRDFEDSFVHMMWSMDQPTIDGVNSYWVSRAARQAGLKVALSGLGGDELFGGYPSFRQVPRLVKTLRPLQSLKPLGRAFRVISAPLVKHWSSPKVAGLFEYGGSYAGAYLLRRGLFMPWELPEVLDGDLAREGWKQLEGTLAIQRDIAPLQSSRSRLACLESCWYMRNQLLRDSDWAGMAHSLEIRVPLVDIELLRSVGKWLGNRYPPGKSAMLDAPLRPLPNAILSRPKTGFSIPVREWLLNRSANGNRERGLRGWAKLVYSHFSN